MYVKEHYATRRDEHGDLYGPFVTTLWEMSAAELRKAEAAADSLTTYEIVHFTVAHRWVRQGGHHMTPLYVDGNRIRYARDAS